MIRYVVDGSARPLADVNAELTAQNGEIDIFGNVIDESPITQEILDRRVAEYLLADRKFRAGEALGAALDALAPAGADIRYSPHDDVAVGDIRYVGDGAGGVSAHIITEVLGRFTVADDEFDMERSTVAYRVVKA